LVMRASTPGDHTGRRPTGSPRATRVHGAQGGFFPRRGVEDDTRLPPPRPIGSVRVLPCGPIGGRWPTRWSGGATVHRPPTRRTPASSSIPTSRSGRWPGLSVATGIRLMSDFAAVIARNPAHKVCLWMDSDQFQPHSAASDDKDLDFLITEVCGCQPIVFAPSR